MADELTGPPMVVYTVEIATMEGTQPRTIAAAYMISEPGRPGEPGWLIFRDHEHQIVAQFNASHVVMAQRGDTAGGSDEDRIRDAMAEAQAHPGRIVTR